MEIRILNKEFQWEYTVDSYKSFIWTERYQGYGDFELYIPMKEGLLDKLQLDYYVEIDDSEYTMIIETLQTVTDPDSGDMLIVSGRDLTSILDRRAEFLTTAAINKAVIDEFSYFLDRAFMVGKAVNKKLEVPNFKYKLPSEYDEKTKEVMSKMFYICFGNDTLPDLISNMLDSLDEEVGYKITLTETNDFFFECYLGEDRSYNQKENPFVIFSSEFGNLYGATFTISKTNYKNQASVRSPSVGFNNGSSSGVITSRIMTAYEWTDPSIPSGLDLRVLSIDGSNIQNNTNAGNFTVWDNAARAEGRMQLGRHKIKNDFEGEGENTPQWTYKKDYFLGDIVQLEDRYGNSGAARITEYIFCDDDSKGEQRYPKFSII